MSTTEIIEKIRRTESPLKKQLLMAALYQTASRKGQRSSACDRRVCFILLFKGGLFHDEVLDSVLRSIGFEKKGRYWLNEDLKMAIKVPGRVCFVSLAMTILIAGFGYK